jgi:toxin ParE1/3/4
VGVVRYTAAAEEDLHDIAAFTVERWGARQADRYIAGLEEFCDLISGYRDLGRECDEIAPGLRRMEHKSHVIFFYPVADGITVSRVLHKSRGLYEGEFGGL